MIRPTLRQLVPIGLLLMAPPVFAQESPEPAFVPPPPWQEQAASLPAWPADVDLLAFPVDVPGSTLTFSIDSRSLAVGTDGVVRYTVVIESSSGARNVQFEGIRCATREYRTYAWGEASRHFRPAQGDRWQKIGKEGWQRYRDELLRDYLCDVNLNPHKPGEILRRLGHPQAF